MVRHTWCFGLTFCLLLATACTPDRTPVAGEDLTVGVQANQGPLPVPPRKSPSRLEDPSPTPQVFRNTLPSSPAPTWELVWQDEFLGGTLDTTKWRVESGPGPWGLNELQYYTADKNHWLKDGALVLEARPERMGPRKYTSARLVTRAAFLYGRIEARIRLPFGKGMFPAFWMLTRDWATPSTYGEIDILEMVGSTKGKENATIWASAHRPDPSDPEGGLHSLSASYTTPDLAWFNDAFHTFGVTWTPTSLAYDVDGTTFFTVAMEAEGSDGWQALQRPMFMILNLAVGGDWAGPPNRSTQWPQRMVVDWVRVYQASGVSGASR